MTDTSSTDRTAGSRPRWFMPLLLAVVIVAVLAVESGWPTGPDYGAFRYLTESFLGGHTRLYADPIRNFFNAPWTLILLIPLMQLPPKPGAEVLSILSLLLLFASIRGFRGRSVPLAHYVVAVAGPPAIFLLFNGQIDALSLAGLVLGWCAIRDRRPWMLSAGFLLMTVKPTQLVLVGLIYLFAIRRWPLRDILAAVSLPLLFSVLSGLFIGFDWPLRYIHNLTVYPPIDNGTVTIWKLAAQIGIPALIVGGLALAALIGLAIVVWRTGVTEWVLAAALATTMVFTPYAWIYHYVLLIPAMLVLLANSRLWAGLAFLAMWTAVVRLFTGGGVYGLSDIVYPITILLGLWVLYFRRPETVRPDSAASR